MFEGIAGNTAVGGQLEGMGKVMAGEGNRDFEIPGNIPLEMPARTSDGNLGNAPGSRPASEPAKEPGEKPQQIPRTI